MLPGRLISVYQQYKQDTDFVASWLASTAKACGYPADLLSTKSWDPPQAKSGRVKGKARKKGTGKPSTAGTTAARKYVVALGDFLPLAEFISTKKPLVQVPDAFSTIINRVIEVRGGFGERMEEHGAQLDPIQDEKHNYFVGVLEAVRDALRPRMSSKAAEASIPDTNKDKTSNRFASLLVYEPSQAFLDSPPVERTRPDNKDDVVYEAESQTSPEELLFAFVLLMNDLYKIRAHIKWIWSNHQDGMFDLAAAAVATNTAVEFARGLIDEVNPLFKTLEGGTLTLTSQFHYLLCLHKGMDPENLVNALSVDNFNYDTYDIADESCLLTYRLLYALPDAISPGSIPLYKEGTFGVYDPNSNRETKTGEQKFQADKILITEIFTELMVVARLVPDYPVADEFLRAIKEMAETLEVPFYGVFAAQVFLDIHHVLRGSIERSFETMVQQTSIMAQNLGSHLDFHKNVKIDNWPASNDHMMLKLQKYIQWIGKDPVFEAKAQKYARTPGLEVDPASRHRLVRYSPVISGLILFRLRAEVHELSIAVANAWGSMTYPAHLYNALQQENLLSPGRRWRDMDTALALLGDSNIWVGEGDNIRPATAAEYFRRFCLQMGVTAAAFADPGKSRKSKKVNLHSRAGPRGIQYGTAAVSSMFAKRYCHPTTEQGVDWTPEHVENILAHSAYEINFSLDNNSRWTVEQIDDPVKLREKRAKAAKDLKGKKSSKPTSTTSTSTTNVDAALKKVAPTDLIRALVMSLTAEALELSFPYLLLHRMSWRLLRAIKEKCDPLLIRTFSPAYMNRESQLPWMIGYIFLAASEGDKRLLGLAGEVVDEFAVYAGSASMLILEKMGFEISEEDSSSGDEESDTDEGEEEEDRYVFF